MATHRTTRQKILTLLQDRTQAEIAKRLGVSTRTIRRWKNEGVEPLPKSRTKLSRAVTTKIRQERHHEAKYQERDRKTGKTVKRPIPKTELPIYIAGTRRMYRDFVTGEPYLSANIFFNVNKLTEGDIFDVLKAFRDSGNYGGYSLVVAVPYGGTSPEGSQLESGDSFGEVPRQFLYKQKGRTKKISDEDIKENLDYMLRHNAGGKIRVIRQIIALPKIRIKQRGAKPIKKK